MSASQPAAKLSYQPPTPISELCTFIERHVCSHTLRPLATESHLRRTTPRFTASADVTRVLVSVRGTCTAGRRRCATHIGRRPTRWPGSTGGTSSCHHSTRTCSHRFSRPWPARADWRVRGGAARGGMNGGPPLAPPCAPAPLPPAPRRGARRPSTGDHPPSILN